MEKPLVIRVAFLLRAAHTAFDSRYGKIISANFDIVCKLADWIKEWEVQNWPSLNCTGHGNQNYFRKMSKNLIIITIDGWSSCGKSTLAKELAKALNYVYID